MTVSIFNKLHSLHQSLFQKRIFYTFIHCRNHMEEMLAENNQCKTYFQVNLLREFGAFTFFMFTVLIQLPKADDVG